MQLRLLRNMSGPGSSAHKMQIETRVCGLFRITKGMRMGDASQRNGSWETQQEQELLIFWIKTEMKTGDASEVDRHREGTEAEDSGGRARLALGDCEGIKVQGFLCWVASLEAPSLNCFCVIAPLLNGFME